MCLLTLAPSLTTNLLPPFALEPWRELGINTERERTFCSNYSRSSQNNEKKEKHTPIPAGLKESAQWSWLYSGGIKPERRGDDEDSGNEDKDEKRRTKKRRRSKKTMQTFHIAGAGISKQILERDIKVYLGPEAEFCSEMKMDCDSVDLGKRDDEREEQWFALRAYQRLTKAQIEDLRIKSSGATSPPVMRRETQTRKPPVLRRHKGMSSCSNCEECMLTKYWFRPERLSANSLTGVERKALLVS